MPKYSAGEYENLSANELLNKLDEKVRRTKTSGKILRYLRKKAKLTQKDVAEKLHIVQSTYAGYENGHHEPNLDILIQLANFHKVTLDYISGRIFNEWMIEPFSYLKENGEGHLIDLTDLAKMQRDEEQQISYMVMEAKRHGEYDPNEATPSSNYRKILRMKIKPPNEEVK